MLIRGLNCIRDGYPDPPKRNIRRLTAPKWGILVTTADYGPDAYEFARNKPITLMNGSNLLHLMEKHGHKARIDLAEAKRLQKGIL